MRTALALLLVLPVSCSTLGHIRRVKCADGLPVRILIDVGCPPDGVCGYTCAPGRWAGEP
jgi:hypothetical protein